MLALPRWLSRRPRLWSDRYEPAAPYVPFFNP